MDETQVQAQLQQMQNFIMQEAEDKASEIRNKAQEEFSIQKSNIVVVEKQKILKEYERKEKQIGVKKKMYVGEVVHMSSRISIQGVILPLISLPYKPYLDLCKEVIYWIYIKGLVRSTPVLYFFILIFWIFYIYFILRGIQWYHNYM